MNQEIRERTKWFMDARFGMFIHWGLYFSIIDWSHPDFPKYGDRQHPMRNREEYKDEKINFDNYLAYMHGQVKKLVTNYGKLDLLWFDFSYDDMCGEKWKATERIKMVRHYQPDGIIDNRLEGSGEDYGSIAIENPLIYSGDFASPEQIIPPQGVCDEKGEPIPWELYATMNNHWGYCNSDHVYKTPIPEESVRIKIGKWMKRNGESLYDCGISELPKPE